MTQASNYFLRLREYHDSYNQPSAESQNGALPLDREGQKRADTTQVSDARARAVFVCLVKKKPRAGRWTLRGRSETREGRGGLAAVGRPVLVGRVLRGAGCPAARRPKRRRQKPPPLFIL